jgi:hypothetical protein
MFDDRITVLVGHFGSGKTELAVNAVMGMAGAGARPVLVDLDVVKPYFRSRAARELLEAAGVDLVAPTGEDLFADLPIVVPQVRAVCNDRLRKVVIDVGGDDTGARALGSIGDVLRDQGVGFDIVLNFRRPFTPDVESAVVMTREIEAAARVRVSGVVSNTHLMHETTPAVVREGYELAAATAVRLGVPIVAVAIEERLVDAAGSFPCPVMALRRVVRPPFDPEAYPTRKSGPVFQLN